MNDHTAMMTAGAFGLECLSRWFLVLSKPAAEQCAQTHLERQGYRVYYPRLICSQLRRGRWCERIVALFPRYLFVQLDVARQSLAPVRSTVGVASVVRFGPDATVVPDDVIEGLIGRADPQSGLHRLADRKLEPGARINVVAGAFSGLDGIFERSAGADRVVVLLSLLGGSTAVCISADFVVPQVA
ncbi:MAG TPA: transcription termination/antitermination NusG family protein [Steroidobacteraceae bacterium]|nr:transcription termination/antitermination NusG family protein [Steroidobacteraceae bacterium]